MDGLREGISLRRHGQKDPLVEYKRESYELFKDLWGRATEEMVRTLFLLHIASADDPQMLGARSRPTQGLNYSGPDEAPDWRGPQRPPGQMDARTAQAIKQVVRKEPKVGRNDPCPCGSGKKYKKCHGQ